MLDQAVNFFNSLVVTAPSPATSGTTMSITGGDAYYIYLKLGLGLDLVVAPVGTAPSRTNAEIITVTAIPNTTITSGSNAASLPQATINVADCSGFPTAGTCTVVTASGPQTVTYTGKTSTTALTGCTGGSGAMSTGGVVVSDQVTITRISQNTTARTIVVGDAVTLDWTAKSRDKVANASSNIGGISIPGAKMINAYLAAAIGHNDAYTVPTGKKAYILQWAWNNTTGTPTVYPEVKIGGTYYELAAAQTPGGITNFTNPIVLNAGESAGMNSTAAAGQTWISAIEFDATVPLSRAMLTSLASGANTLYTCPAAKSARILPNSSQNLHTSATITYVNQSGAARTSSFHSVPSGSSPATTNLVTSSAARADQTWSALAVNTLMLGAGDFIDVTTDAATATQFAWMTVIEFPL